MPTDRPGQANNPQILGINQFMVQNGITFGRTNTDNPLAADEFKTNRFSNELNLRYGLFEWLELNGTFIYDRFNQVQPGPSFAVDGISLLSLGVRARLFQSTNGRTVISLLGLVDTDFVSEVFSTNSYLLRARLLASHQVSDQLSLTLNFGFSQPDALNDFYDYVVNLSYQVSTRASVFIELYGQGLLNNRDFFSVDNTFYDGGLMYLINNSLSLDLSAGYAANFNGAVTEYFVSAGVSYRLGQ